jgi:putative aldouronate transport system permease protein
MRAARRRKSPVSRLLARMTVGDLLFDSVNYLALIVVVVLCLFPYLNVVAKSLSRDVAVLAGDVFLWPVDMSLNAYRVVLGSNRFMQSLLVSVGVAAVGTVINVCLTVVIAYIVSRNGIKGGQFISFLYIFTMLFSGGLIPTYLVVRNAGLVDSLWALIIPGLVAPFNMIILRNYFHAIPDSLEESAKIDGAGNIRILLSIMVPLALPSIATIALFYAVGYWNSYFDALIYINTRSFFPLQVYLRDIIMAADPKSMNIDSLMNVAQESVQGATVVASTVPILCVYPFLQRYFVKGVMLGAVKQ